MIKKILITIVVTLFSFSAFAQSKTINGAGATFPYALYSTWAYFYNVETKTQVNYQGIGSGGGIKQIIAKTVDFGATDDPMSAEELKENGLIQFPTAIGGVVLVINIDGVKNNELTLSPEIVAGIYMGKITKWSDPAIKALNPSLKLPDANITAVQRSDSSGTTAIFTKYLSEASTEWANSMGQGKAVNWVTGISGKGSEGIAGYVKQVKNSIGYVEFSYANQNKIATALLINKAGKKVSPSFESFEAAAKSAKWDSANGYNTWLTNSSDANAWPIVGATFVLVRKDNPAVSKEVLKFFEWSFNKGNETAKKLFYVTLPESLKKEIVTNVTASLK